MSAVAPILVTKQTGNVLQTDSATVASNTTLSPAGFDQNGVARWEDRSGGIPVGFPTFTMEFSRPAKSGARVYRVKAKLVVPVLEVPGSVVVGFEPPPQVAFTNEFHLTALMHERSSPTNRIEALQMFRSLLVEVISASDGAPTDNTGSPVGSAIATLEQPY